MDRKWSAKWISSKDYVDLKPRNIYYRELPWTNRIPQHDETLQNDHILIRKTFVINNINDAKLYISADDNYRVYINGKRVGFGPASNYYFHYFYNVYDISEYLNKGENIIALHVYYAGIANTRAFDSGDFRQGVIAEIINDGKVVLETDNTWKYKHALWYHEKTPMVFKIQYKENTDFRLKDTTWMNLEYDDLRGNRSVCRTQSSRHDVLPHSAAGVL